MADLSFVWHGDPDDPFVTVEDMMRILRLTGANDEERLKQFRRFLEAKPKAKQGSPELNPPTPCVSDGDSTTPRNALSTREGGQRPDASFEDDVRLAAPLPGLHREGVREHPHEALHDRVRPDAGQGQGRLHVAHLP